MMKNKIAMICLLIFFTLTTSVSAEVSERVFDNAELFTANEVLELEQSVNELKEKMDMDVAIVTTDDAQGKSARTYATDFYEENNLGMGNGMSGVLFLIDMDNREIFIVTHGRMITYLTDDRIDSILDDAFDGVSEGHFAQAAHSFLSGVEEYFDAGIVNNQYQYNEETGEVIRYRSLEVNEIALAIVGALLLGGGFYGIVALKYGGRKGKYKFPLRKNSTVQLTSQQDVFVNRTVTKTRIPKNNNNSGGFGGGGRSTTFGGGGRKF